MQRKERRACHTFAAGPHALSNLYYPEKNRGLTRTLVNAPRRPPATPERHRARVHSEGNHYALRRQALTSTPAEPFEQCLVTGNDSTGCGELTFSKGRRFSP